MTLLSDDNPCKSCPPEDICCFNPRYFKLSRNEYERFFARYRTEGKIIVHKSSDYVVISGMPDAFCPYFEEGCTIHDIRPVECELYPYAINLIHRFGNYVFVGMHNFKKNCPNQEQVIIKEDYARSLILDFARDTFGDNCRVTVYKEYSWINQAINNYWSAKDYLRTYVKR